MNEQTLTSTDATKRTPTSTPTTNNQQPTPTPPMTTDNNEHRSTHRHPRTSNGCSEQCGVEEWRYTDCRLVRGGSSLVVRRHIHTSSLTGGSHATHCQPAQTPQQQGPSTSLTHTHSPTLTHTHSPTLTHPAKPPWNMVTPLYRNCRSCCESALLFY